MKIYLKPQVSLFRVQFKGYLKPLKVEYSTVLSSILYKNDLTSDS